MIEERIRARMSQAQARAAAVERYANAEADLGRGRPEESLLYLRGKAPGGGNFKTRWVFEEGRPVWRELTHRLGLTPVEITAPHSEYLINCLPAISADFHSLSAQLTQSALTDRLRGESEPLGEVEMVLTGALITQDELEMVELWKSAAERGFIFPETSRPDLVITKEGRMVVIEYNVDAGADLGFTHGVGEYSRRYLGMKPIGAGLGELMVARARALVPEEEKVVVATVLPEGYREEYDSQSRFFAKRASQIGKSVGVTWLAVKPSQVEVTGEGVFVNLEAGPRRIDLIDREFELAGYGSRNGYEDERRIVKAWLEDGVKLMGTILPLSDKAFLAFMYDPLFENLLLEILAANPNPSHVNLSAAKRLERIRNAHAETRLLDPRCPGVVFDGRFSSWEEIGGDRRLKDRLVLKRAGRGRGMTGSAGVVIGPDTSLPVWKDAFDTALEETGRAMQAYRAKEEGKAVYESGCFWVLQRFHPSRRDSVVWMRNSRTGPMMATDVALRVAPYSVWNGTRFVVGDCLVTAGTDSKTREMGYHNIHGQFGNTYTVLEVKDD